MLSGNSLGCGMSASSISTGIIGMQRASPVCTSMRTGSASSKILGEPSALYRPMRADNDDQNRALMEDRSPAHGRSMTCSNFCRTQQTRSRQRSSNSFSTTSRLRSSFVNSSGVINAFATSIRRSRRSLAKCRKLRWTGLVNFSDLHRRKHSSELDAPSGDPPLRRRISRDVPQR